MVIPAYAVVLNTKGIDRRRRGTALTEYRAFGAHPGGLRLSRRDEGVQRLIIGKSEH